MSRSFSRSSTLAIIRSTIWMISFGVSWWKTTVSSTRLRNSGRKCCLSSSLTFDFIRSYDALLVVLPREADRQALGDVAGAEVRRHDDDGVLEVHHPALGVGQATVLQDLQQRVEDVGVGLLDLVEQDHGERLAADLLGELAALFVADVSGRGTEQPRDGVLLHELGHVELDQRVLVAEQELRQRLGQLGLTDTGRAGEDERTTGTLGVLQTGAGTPDRLGQRLDGVVLADDPLVELVLHAEQAGALLLGELEDRNAGRRRENLRDQLLGDLGDDVHVAGLPFLLPLRLRPGEAASPGRAARRPSRSPARRSRTPCRAARSAIFSSYSRRSGGAVMRRMRMREPASSMRSIALSGRNRSLM